MGNHMSSIELWKLLQLLDGDYCIVLNYIRYLKSCLS